MVKKVLVSGCFDLLHSGHVEFFNQAASYGDLFVAIGSDQTVFELKGKLPVNNEFERLFMVKSIRNVKDAFISKGSGMLDFVEEFKELRPDYFIVNSDGDLPEKEALCHKYSVEYIILKREPYNGLPSRSTTHLRTINQIPYRIDLAGGWLDQPFVSKHYPGSVITISLEPTYPFNKRSGMASSTRRSAIELWGPRIPPGKFEKLAKILFCFDNPPGTNIISGSQDSIGIIYPGLAKVFYEGKYWPKKIERLTGDSYLKFVEESLYLVTLGPRNISFDVLEHTEINSNNAKALADAADLAWESIKNYNLVDFGMSIRASFEAQIRMFPNMVNDSIFDLIKKYQDTALGWKLSGAGGGGYLILVSDRPIPNTMNITARRPID